MDTLRFRVEPTNEKGLRPIPVQLSNGKTYDWNSLTRKERKALETVFKKKSPKVWAKIQASKKLKIYEEPIRENVYFCDQCNKTHVAHELDEGAVPAFISCHNCSYPQARSLGYDIPDSYKGAAPQIVFRYSTREEYDKAPGPLREHLEKGGLFMEVVK